MIHSTDVPVEITSFFEQTPDLVCIADREGFFQKINPAVIDKLEYAAEELFSRPISSFIHPDDRILTAAERTKLLNGKPLINFQNRYISKSGKVIWLHWTSIYIPDKQVVFAIAKDVTDRKLIEAEVEEKYNRFKVLVGHFKNTMEKDRKNLAIELHEGLAQLAATIKLNIGWLTDDAEALPEQVKSRLNCAATATELLIQTIRRLSFSISPSLLGDVGLKETLNWLCREFSVLTKIPCKLNNNFNESCLSEEIRLDFFRICQEALSNVIDQERACKVTITIRKKSNTLSLIIKDDGKGFDVGQKKDVSALTGISERVASINGTLKIENRSGQGTALSVTVTL